MITIIAEQEDFDPGLDGVSRDPCDMLADFLDLQGLKLAEVSNCAELRALDEPWSQATDDFCNGGEIECDLLCGAEIALQMDTVSELYLDKYRSLRCWA